jgi:hypothetical protein
VQVLLVWRNVKRVLELPAFDTRVLVSAWKPCEETIRFANPSSIKFPVKALSPDHEAPLDIFGHIGELETLWKALESYSHSDMLLIRRIIQKTMLISMCFFTKEGKEFIISAATMVRKYKKAEVRFPPSDFNCVLDTCNNGLLPDFGINFLLINLKM